MMKSQTKGAKAIREWTENNRAAALLSACRRSSTTRGMSFTNCITLQDVEKMLVPMKCQVTGLPLSWDWDRSKGKKDSNPWAPSIDRIDNSKGYTRDNVRLVCWAFNRARGTWPDEVFDQVARAYIEAQNDVASFCSPGSIKT